MAAVGDKRKAEPEYEFEDPIELWIDLCQACRIEHPQERQVAVMAFLNVARDSHWTHELMEAQMLQDEDVDYSGQDNLRGSTGTVDTEPYQDDEGEGEGDIEAYGDVPVDAHSMKE